MSFRPFQSQIVLGKKEFIYLYVSVSGDEGYSNFISTTTQASVSLNDQAGENGEGYGAPGGNSGSYLVS